MLIVGMKEILFSYQTPVAMFDQNTHEAFRTSKKWSATTTRHINQWFGERKSEEKPQEYFDNLMKEVA
jgi:hypothetical protein